MATDNLANFAAYTAGVLSVVNVVISSRLSSKVQQKGWRRDIVGKKLASVLKLADDLLNDQFNIATSMHLTHTIETEGDIKDTEDRAQLRSLEEDRRRIREEVPEKLSELRTEIAELELFGNYWTVLYAKRLHEALSTASTTVGIGARKSAKARYNVFKDAHTQARSELVRAARAEFELDGQSAYRVLANAVQAPFNNYMDRLRMRSVSSSLTKAENATAPKGEARPTKDPTP